MSTDARIDSILSLNPSELFDDEAEYRHLCRLFEKQFGEGIFGPLKRTVTFASKRSARRLSHLNPFKKTGYTEVYQNKNGIKITLDVQQFKVGELSIKVVDQCIVIEGKHKDRKDYHGFIARSFTRKYFLPKTMDPSTLSAKLSLDGLLVVTATSKLLPPPKVRVVDICCTRKRALGSVAPNKGPIRPAAARQAAQSATKLPKKVKADKTTKPRAPKLPKSGSPKPRASETIRLPKSGGPKPQASESITLQPQSPKQSGKAQ